MKRIVFSLTFITLILVGNGQKTKIDYGFQSGLNISNAYGDGISKDYRAPITGLHVGGHVQIRKTENWGFKFLIAYDQIGWAYKSLALENNTGTGLVNGDISFKLNYLNLPVLAEYSFGKKVKLNIDAGLFLGLLLNNKIITKLQEPIPPNQEAITESSSDRRKAANFGLSLGSSIQLPIASKLKLDINFIDNLGLSNIYKSNSSDMSQIKTNTLSISAGLTFEI